MTVKLGLVSPAAGGSLVELAERFPPGFVWGVATSAFQIEGATQEDGRGDSIWDVFCRRPGAILDASSGAVACDHYHRFDADVALIDSLNVEAYRFSIAWPRVQPLGYGAWNEAGFAFYDRLIDSLLRRGIAPHLTLYHWDLPQGLQQQGGWSQRETALRFADYAQEVGRRFGDRLASIGTINEPWVVATLGYLSGIFAPGETNRRVAMQVSHHLLLGHGLALQRLRAQGLRTPLGIVLNQSPTHPATDTHADRAKARIDDGLLIRWYTDALLRGEYPQDVLDELGADRPDTEPGDMAVIAQPLDFLGINYYTRNLASVDRSIDELLAGRELTDMGWEIYPAGLTELLLRLQHDYRLPPVYITENGAAFPDQLVNSQVSDPARIRYLHSHISAVADAIAAGVDVRGYFAWSLLDNFEWASGYAKRFGIVYVDYATQERIPKESAYWYRDLLAAARQRAVLRSPAGALATGS